MEHLTNTEERVRPKLKMVVTEAAGCSDMAASMSVGAPKSATKLTLLPLPASQVSGAYLVVKRVCDIVLSLLMLGILFIPLAITAIIICAESRGPVIYRRRVLAKQSWRPSDGKNALETFDAYKLRTMVHNADQVLVQSPKLYAEFQKDWKLEDDPRVTRVGARLRTWSLDEVPQLMNVLRGQMTLVGPRMITPPELDRYGVCAPTLLTVKPGLTGLWQVSGRQELSYEERVRLDILYIDTRSFALDLQILFKTVVCVLRRQGAY